MYTTLIKKILDNRTHPPTKRKSVFIIVDLVLNKELVSLIRNRPVKLGIGGFN